MKKRELSYIVGGNGIAIIENSIEFPQDTRNRSTSYPTSGRISKGMRSAYAKTPTPSSLLLHHSQ
jgi:hypothetical protein